MRQGGSRGISCVYRPQDCWLLVSKMRMIVINPETPTGVFFKAGLIAQDCEAGIFDGSDLVEVLKRFACQRVAEKDPGNHCP